MRVLYIIVGVLMMSGFSWGKAEVPRLEVTGIHKAITQETDWLNTERALTAEDLNGRIILLDFWTFCCINCIHVIPDLQYLEETFGHDLIVIGVHSAKFANEKDSENIRSAIVRYDIEHPVVNDADFRTWRDFAVRAWPTMVLINPEGKIAHVYSGEGNRKEIEADIRELQKEYQGHYVTEPLPIALEKDKAPKTVLSFPSKLAFGKRAIDGKDVLFISDSKHHRIVATDLQGNIVWSAGSGVEGNKDGALDDAQFNTPQGVLYRNGLLYVADTENHTLRKIDINKGTVDTIAGIGKQGYKRMVSNEDALSTPLASPWDVAFYPDANHIAIAMAGTHQLWTYHIDTQTVSVLAGNGRESIDDGRYPFNSLSQPSGLSVYDGKLYFVDSETSSLRVLEGDSITTLIGTGLFDFGFEDGKQGKALMQHSLGVYADASGVYIADSYNHAIRRYNVETGELTTLAGNGVRGADNITLADSRFNEPNDIVRVGDVFYVADTNNNILRVLDEKANTVKNLAVMPQAQPVAYAEFLPNVEHDGEVMLASGAEVALGLPSDWKINDEAPSYMALFDGDVLVQAWDRDALVDLKATLPALEQGKEYRLQGTFYYCEKKEGALCLISSADYVVKAGEGEEKLGIILKQ